MPTVKCCDCVDDETGAICPRCGKEMKVVEEPKPKAKAKPKKK